MKCPKCRCECHPVKEDVLKKGFSPICSDCAIKEKSLKHVVIMYRKTV